MSRTCTPALPQEPISAQECDRDARILHLVAKLHFGFQVLAGFGVWGWEVKFGADSMKKLAMCGVLLGGYLVAAGWYTLGSRGKAM